MRICKICGATLDAGETCDCVSHEVEAIKYAMRMYDEDGIRRAIKEAQKRLDIVEGCPDLEDEAEELSYYIEEGHEYLEGVQLARDMEADRRADRYERAEAMWRW